GRDDAEYHLAVTLRERDEPGDAHNAADMLIRAASRSAAIPDADFPFAVACTIDLLARLERWADAEALLGTIAPARIAPITLMIMRANLRVAQGKYDQASKIADEALAELTPDSLGEDRRKLAVLLHDLGRYRDALPLWQVLAPPGSLGTDTRRLLDCASRLGREDIALDLMRRMRPDGAAESSSTSELEKLERSDPEAALQMIEEQLAEHPEDRVMRLRRSILGARMGRSELVVSDPNAMPSIRVIPPQLGRGAVQIMRDAGRANESLSYAYELLRTRPNNIDTHRAYLAALGPIGPMPHVPDFESAAPGAAVCFVEQDQNVDRWVTLEDGADPDESRDEYNLNHPLTKVLKNKKVGEKFQLPEGRFSRKAGVIKQIISKYAYRYQDCLAGWQTRFPGQPETEIVYRQPEAILWSETPDDLEPIFESAAKGVSDPAKVADRAYINNAIPIHAVAQHLNMNDLQAMFVMAQRPEVPIKCCVGSAEELAWALAALERSNSIVLDLTAIATLCLLGRLNLLATWPRQFLVSQATLAELRKFAFEDTLMRLPPGFSA
ncbi:MAG TPA: hypothetical protein VIX12_07430, partial [Candidatus Binataceae bacterium]